jgi:hypothetical protein
VWTVLLILLILLVSCVFPSEAALIGVESPKSMRLLGSIQGQEILC